MSSNSNLALTFTKILPPSAEKPVDFTLYLSAEERTRSRHRWETAEGKTVVVRLPRGRVTRDGDLLTSETGQVLRIAAKPEPTLTVTGKTPLDLLRAAYHLGNRHVPLEISPTYLRLSPDPVLESMLVKLGVSVTAEIIPFQPEIGAYSLSHPGEVH
jgi:urease accessory protein